MYAFGPFVLDPANGRLTCSGRRIAVPGKAWQILLLLAEAGGRLVPHETFRSKLWPNVVVEDRTLTVHMSTLRHALVAGSPEDYIETVARAGYRLTVPVRVHSEALASQKDLGRLDPPSQQDGRLVIHSTDSVPAAHRVAFWRDGVLRRMEPMEMPQTERPFHARLRRIVGEGVELIEHASNAVFAVRSTQRRRVDGCDDIGIDVMRRCTGAAMEHNGEHRIRPGDLYMTDYAQPSQVRRSEHRTAGIMLPRQRVRDAVGDVSAMAGIKFGAIGLAAVLRRHMCTTFDEATVMSSAERLVALKAAADMTLALMQVKSNRPADVEQFDSGFYRAAHVVIERDCGDPELRPDRVALILGCSRASLYRAFARRDESVAAMIWQARTARAWGLLTSAEGVGLLVLDIALLSGFRDMPTFARMFKRRYGMTPCEARASVRS